MRSMIKICPICDKRDITTKGNLAQCNKCSIILEIAEETTVLKPKDVYGKLGTYSVVYQIRDAIVDEDGPHE